MDPGTYVEVQESSDCWNLVRVRDIIYGEPYRLAVCFQGSRGDTWHDREVEASRARMPPRATREAEVEETWVPKVDDVVEIMKPSAPLQPASWIQCIVRTCRGSFVYVSIPGQHRTQDLVLKREEVRRVSTEPTLDKADLCRDTLHAAKELTPWLLSDDARRCINHVRVKAGLLNAALCGDLDTGISVLLVGELQCVTLAKRLLSDVHFRHQAEIRRNQVNIRRAEDKLLHVKEQSAYMHVEFSIEERFLGRLIGKKGANLQNVQNSFDVSMRVLETRPVGEPTKRTVMISGKSLESIKDAQKSTQIVQVQVPLRKEEIGWALGRGYKNIQEIARKADLTDFHFDSNAQALQLFGLQESVDTARMLIQTHNDYQQVFADIMHKRGDMQRLFEELQEREDAKKRAQAQKGARKDANTAVVGDDPSEQPGAGNQNNDVPQNVAP